MQVSFHELQETWHGAETSPWVGKIFLSLLLQLSLLRYILGNGTQRKTRDFQLAMFVSDFQMLIHNLSRGMHHLYSYSLIVSYVFLVVIYQELYQDQNSLLDQGMIKLMIFHECWTFPTGRWKQWWSSLIAFSDQTLPETSNVSEGIGPKVEGCNGYLKIKSLFRLMMGLFNILQYIGTL